MIKHWLQKMGGISAVGMMAGLMMAGCESTKPGGEAGEGGAPAKKEDKKAGDKKVNFLTDVKPLLENYCLRCHNTGLLLGDLNLETRKLAFTPGEAGPFIIPKHPETSKFYLVLKLQYGSKEAMPPEKHRMTKEEHELIYRWIKQGADWPKDSRGTLKPVVVRPTVAMLGEAR